MGCDFYRPDLFREAVPSPVTPMRQIPEQMPVELLLPQLLTKEHYSWDNVLLQRNREKLKQENLRDKFAKFCKENGFFL